mmetsp:Transcript_49833/g.74323  ORF Transcript_49833/g.74323 Transcript_49833/m.74323 type:complete len:85 (+) Transcript_49833:252-506(+)
MMLVAEALSLTEVVSSDVAGWVSRLALWRAAVEALVAQVSLAEKKSHRQGAAFSLACVSPTIHASYPTPSGALPSVDSVPSLLP